METTENTSQEQQPKRDRLFLYLFLLMTIASVTLGWLYWTQKSETQVVIRHALRGGLMPVVSYTGPALAFLVTGTVVIERIFVLPGLGSYFIQASLNRDEPLILGIVAFVAITLLLMNLLVDIAYAYLDPRIRY